MTLHSIVAAFGGDLYAAGRRANIPAPGHSAADRSVSLLLAGDRVVIHGFGAMDWRVARDHLMERGFIDHDGRLTGRGVAGPSAPNPDNRLRVQAAARLWDGVRALDGSTPADAHLRLRSISDTAGVAGIGFHGAAPISVYRDGGATRPSLVARISDDADRLTAVELTYLEPNGRLARLRLPRKTVGLVPAGAAVRLDPAGPEMLVAEGVATTLSARSRFALPSWALMAAHNLARWTPPSGVRSVVIAADRGRTGITAAHRLEGRLRLSGVRCRVLPPEPPYDDWNEAAAAIGGEEEGR